MTLQELEDYVMMLVEALKQEKRKNTLLREEIERLNELNDAYLQEITEKDDDLWN